MGALAWGGGGGVTVVPSANNRFGGVIVVNPAGRERLAALGNFRFSRLLRQKLAATQEPAGRPRLWRFVDSLPVSDMGKRREQDLQDLFTEGSAP